MLESVLLNLTSSSETFVSKVVLSSMSRSDVLGKMNIPIIVAGMKIRNRGRKLEEPNKASSSDSMVQKRLFWNNR